MLEQVSKQAVLPVAFVVAVLEVIAGITQAVRQFATWELQDIMQFVVVVPSREWLELKLA